MDRESKPILEDMRLPPLRTDRLVLREIVESDAEGLHAAFGDAAAMRFWNFPATRTVAETAVMIKRGLAGGRSRHGVWAILHRDGPFLGMINYHHRDPQSQRLELGWIVVPAYWRQGIMTEAASAVLGHCFGALNTHRVEALIEPENLSSLALAAKLGFMNEGLLRERLLVSGGFRNVQMHALLRSEWRKQRSPLVSALSYVDMGQDWRMRRWMSEQVAWCAELVVLPDQLDSFIELTAEMVAETAEEPGVLTYQRFISDDERIVHAVERYENSGAALGHLRTFLDKFAERFSSAVTRRRFTVYGTPSPELKAILDGFGAIYFRPLGDLPYWA